MRNILFFCFLIFSLNANENIIGNNPHLPLVAIVTTGGTIAEKTDPKTGASVPTLSGEDLVASVPLLKRIANIKVVNFSNIDSSQMTPEIWAKLSKTVDDICVDPKIRGVVVTHGTDTMAEGAYFLDITLKTKKPVVFVGAMKNASDPYSDGPPNLLNGVFQVISDKSYDWGVTVTMNEYINSAKSVVKTQTTNIQTFESGEKGYLGYLFEGRVYRFNDCLHRINVPIPSILPNVILYSDYAGSDGGFIYYAVDKQNVQGIVVESLGIGNVNSKVFEAIKYALSHGIAVVVTSRVFFGAVYPVYGDKGGGEMLKEAGAVICGNLGGPKARLLLTLLIPYVGKDPKILSTYFAVP